MRSPESPRVEDVSGALVNEISALPGEINLILDDYHMIYSEPVHKAVAFFLDHLPENLHLIISSRTDPPLPLPRLHARNEIVELKAADLRFTAEEATAFLTDVMGMTLSRSDVAALGEITEGWVAALQLAALSMRDREDVSGFVEAFSGSNRHILDFLAEEVLERQPEVVREFLLKTSVLERMTDSLCDVLTGRADGQAMLERLEKENLFVVPLDEERRWYRYHHLFAGFLRTRLERENPGSIPRLHLRTSGWYEENGWFFEAVGHALAGEDYERAADLVERVAREAWSRGEILTLLGWLRRLPGEVMRCRPKLLLDQATASVLSGQLDAAETPLLEAEDAAANADEARRRYLLGYAAGVRSWRARLLGDTSDAIELARRSLTLLPEDEPGLRSFAAIGLGDAHRDAGNLAAASEAFTGAEAFGRAAGHNMGLILGMVEHARVKREQGRLREAQDLLRRAQALAAEKDVELSPAAGFIRLEMGTLHYEWDALATSEHCLAEGMGAGPPNGRDHRARPGTRRTLAYEAGARRYGGRQGGRARGRAPRAKVRCGPSDNRGDDLEGAFAPDGRRGGGSSLRVRESTRGGEGWDQPVPRGGCAANRSGAAAPGAAR